MARMAGLQPELRSAAGPAAAAAERQQAGPQGRDPRREASQDQLFSSLALALWCITSAKSALASPLLAHHNLQSLTGAAAILAVGLAWPSLAPRSYARWRVPALAALRLLLMALPYNFEEGLWDDVFPSAASGHHLAWALNLSNFAVGTGMLMLALTALGWRLPLRVHMAVQAVLVGLWFHFGVGPHCRSKLVTSPEVSGAVSAVYNAFELTTALLVPIAARPPGGPRTQAVSVLLFGWLLFGWLLPTLLLLLPVAGSAPATARHLGRPGGGRCSRAQRWLAAAGHALAGAEACLLCGLQSLLVGRAPGLPVGMPRGTAGTASGAQQAQQQQEREPREDLPAVMQLPLALRWLIVLLLLLWLPCRTLAPWYAAEGGPLAVQRAG